MKIIVFILLATVQSVVGQGDLSSLITVRIDKDSLNYDSAKKSLTVPLLYSYHGKEPIMVYGMLGRPSQVPFELQRLCDLKNTGTGVAFAVYNAKGDQLMYEITIKDYLYQKPVTREVLDSVFRAVHERFRKSKKILSKNDSLAFDREVSIVDFLLEPGLYYLQVAYYSGEKIFNAIDAEEVRKSRIKLFQGCIISNKVPFKVK